MGKQCIGRWMHTWPTRPASFVLPAVWRLTVLESMVFPAWRLTQTALMYERWSQTTSSQLRLLFLSCSVDAMLACTAPLCAACGPLRQFSEQHSTDPPNENRHRLCRASRR